MRLLNRLEHRFGRFAIPHLTLLIMVGQGAAFILSFSDPNFLERLELIPAEVIAGDYWRLLTFVFYPFTTMPIFFFFAMLIFHLMGNSLEQTWGVFRYNLFLLVGYVATVGAAFALPELRGQPMTNGFVYGTVFLAFAWLYPNYVFHIMFILPVKVKWLAWITWAMYTYRLLTGSNTERILIFAAVANFLLFFGRDIYDRVRSRQRRVRQRIEAAAASGKGRPFHQCRECGATDQDNPQLDFRYCSQCMDNACYCEVHIRDHEHIDGASSA